MQSRICLRNLVTSEIHSYLQNSNSTFFLIYAYRQLTTSLSFTYYILMRTRNLHTQTSSTPPFAFLSHRQTTSTDRLYVTLHILAKITARLTVIQLTEMSWHYVTLYVLKVIIYILIAVFLLLHQRISLEYI